MSKVTEKTQATQPKFEFGTSRYQKRELRNAGVAEHVCDLTFLLGCQKNDTGFAAGQTLEWVIHRERLASGCLVRL